MRREGGDLVFGRFDRLATLIDFVAAIVLAGGTVAAVLWKATHGGG